MALIFQPLKLKLFEINLINIFLNRKLAASEEWSSLKIHIAMDNAVVIEEIGKSVEILSVLCSICTRLNHYYLFL